jgi:chromosome segregation ATPase
MAFFSNKELTAAQASLATVTEQLTTAKAEVEGLKTQLAAANAELETLKTDSVAKASLTELQTRVEELTTQNAELVKNQKAAEILAMEITSAQGNVPPVPVPPQIISEGNLTSDLKELSAKPYIKQADLEALMKKHSTNLNATANP